jgi:pyrroloquinoline quinone (PQQ) biosynthesis protein C
MTIAQTFNDTIDLISKNAGNKSSFIHQAVTKKLRIEEILIYLNQIKFVLERTPIYLELARTISKEINNQKLVHFFENKIIEEQGHVEWAISDIEHWHKLAKTLGKFCPHQEILSPFKNLMDTVLLNLKKDPFSYFVYSYFVELNTVQFGDFIVSNLCEQFKTDRKTLSALANHIELDVLHVNEGQKEVQNLMETEAQLKAAIDYASQYATLLYIALDSITDSFKSELGGPNAKLV